MTNFFETTVDKFIFRVATDRFYSRDGLWAKKEGSRVLVGLSDFVQQRNGDVAFVEVKEPGKQVEAGSVLSVIETIKVDIELPSPVSGIVVEVNPDMDDNPEVINQDPYGQGWIALLEVSDWEAEKAGLLEPQAYFELMKKQAEAEASRL